MAEIISHLNKKKMSEVLNNSNYTKTVLNQEEFVKLQENLIGNWTQQIGITDDDIYNVSARLDDDQIINKFKIDALNEIMSLKNEIISVKEPKKSQDFPNLEVFSESRRKDLAEGKDLESGLIKMYPKEKQSDMLNFLGSESYQLDQMTGMTKELFSKQGGDLSKKSIYEKLIIFHSILIQKLKQYIADLMTKQRTTQESYLRALTRESNVVNKLKADDITLRNDLKLLNESIEGRINVQMESYNLTEKISQIKQQTMNETRNEIGTQIEMLKDSYELDNIAKKKDVEEQKKNINKVVSEINEVLKKTEVCNKNVEETKTEINQVGKNIEDEKEKNRRRDTIWNDELCKIRAEHKKDKEEVNKSISDLQKVVKELTEKIKKQEEKEDKANELNKLVKNKHDESLALIDEINAKLTDNGIKKKTDLSVRQKSLDERISAIEMKVKNIGDIDMVSEKPWKEDYDKIKELINDQKVKLKSDYEKRIELIKNEKETLKEKIDNLIDSLRKGKVVGHDGKCESLEENNISNRIQTVERQIKEVIKKNEEEYDENKDSLTKEVSIREEKIKNLKEEAKKEIESKVKEMNEKYAKELKKLEDDMNVKDLKEQIDDCKQNIAILNEQVKDLTETDKKEDAEIKDKGRKSNRVLKIEKDIENTFNRIVKLEEKFSELEVILNDNEIEYLDGDEKDMRLTLKERVDKQEEKEKEMNESINRMELEIKKLKKDKDSDKIESATSTKKKSKEKMEWSLSEQVWKECQNKISKLKENMSEVLQLKESIKNLEGKLGKKDDMKDNIQLENELIKKMNEQAESYTKKTNKVIDLKLEQINKALKQLNEACERDRAIKAEIETLNNKSNNLEELDEKDKINLHVHQYNELLIEMNKYKEQLNIVQESISEVRTDNLTLNGKIEEIVSEINKRNYEEKKIINESIKGSVELGNKEMKEIKKRRDEEQLKLKQEKEKLWNNTFGNFKFSLDHQCLDEDKWKNLSNEEKNWFYRERDLFKRNWLETMCCGKEDAYEDAMEIWKSYRNKEIQEIKQKKEKDLQLLQNKMKIMSYGNTNNDEVNSGRDVYERNNPENLGIGLGYRGRPKYSRMRSSRIINPWNMNNNNNNISNGKIDNHSSNNSYNNRRNNSRNINNNNNSINERFNNSSYNNNFNSGRKYESRNAYNFNNNNIRTSSFVRSRGYNNRRNFPLRRRNFWMNRRNGNNLKASYKKNGFRNPFMKMQSMNVRQTFVNRRF